MGRGAVFLGVSYLGLVLLGVLGLWAIEGSPPGTPPPPGTTPPSGTPNASEWDLPGALLFVTTLLTTVGSGPATPLSAAGRAFCAAYAPLGVWATTALLAAAARRLGVPLAERPRRYLRARWGFSRRGAARAHLAALLGLTWALLVLLPAGALCLLEGSWTFLDGLYFCLVSLCTVGPGDLAPAKQPRQPLRQLYQVALAVYLLLGVTGFLLLAQTLRHVAELHGLPGAAAGPGDGADRDEGAGLLEGDKPAQGGRGAEGEGTG